MHSVPALLTLVALTADGGQMAHFQSVDGKPLAGYDDAWNALQEFFGPATPPTFTVVEKPSAGPAQFNSAKLRLLIPKDSLEQRGAPTLAHEGAHVCLSRLTAGASELEFLRFIDEGLATLIEHRVAGSLSQFDRAAREAAAVQLAAGNLSLEKLAKWTAYFGSPDRPTAYAYSVGAAFVLYVQSTLGEERFKALLAELGRERNLDRAASKALGQGAAQVEAAWIASLSSVRPERPAVTGLEPKQATTGVPVSTRELRVTLNSDMSSRVCVAAACGASNICFTGARWASPRELVIVPDGPLLPHHRYRIGLGVAGRCSMTSLNGQELEPVVWEFSTE